MSRTTDINNRGLFLYQVYVRSHTKEGTFTSFNNDIDRIKALGADYIYFIPIHPIGVIKRKGSLGCPYSIQDYRAVNPEYGTMEDFLETIERIHDAGMKVMIDVVYNHTSHDSVLLHEHPEYFLHDENGHLVSKEPDWSDIQDLDYSIGMPLYKELTATLLFWMKQGVDGFRFDVTSFLPIEFLEYMSKELRALNPDVLLLSESVHGGYCRHMRNKGYEVLSESEIYQIFDMAYDYDIHDYFVKYLEGKSDLNMYLKMMLLQEEIYPKNYIKMRNLENHDFGRFADFVKNDPVKIDNWTAFNFFAKGSAMIYAGQEFSELNKPSLFEKEDVLWTGRDISPLIKTLSQIMKSEIMLQGVFNIEYQEKDVIYATYKYNGKTLLGLFNVGKESGIIQTDVPSKDYQNLLDGDTITIKDGVIKLTQKPVIIVV